VGGSKKTEKTSVKTPFPGSRRRKVYNCGVKGGGGKKTGAGSSQAKIIGGHHAKDRPLPKKHGGKKKGKHNLVPGPGKGSERSKPHMRDTGFSFGMKREPRKAGNFNRVASAKRINWGRPAGARLREQEGTGEANQFNVGEKVLAVGESLCQAGWGLPPT